MGVVHEAEINGETSSAAPAIDPLPGIDRDRFGQIVLVFQGGGALGAYQGGVYQALAEAGIRPDWVIGTSIGAINAALIVGNTPALGLARLIEFWAAVRQDAFTSWINGIPFFGAAAAALTTTSSGLRGFFEPNPAAWLGMHATIDPERAGFYGCAPLRRTLERLVDLDTLNSSATRLTIGAANVGTGQMRYFDTHRERLSLDHVMASGALPPAFPAVRIEGALYWDGGVLSNTPVEAVFDDNPRRSSVVFSVHVWNPQGDAPDTLWKVISREKDLRYASRTSAHIERQRQLHRLRHVVTALARHIPPNLQQDPEVRALTAYGCVTRMHVVRLVAPALEGEDHNRDIDFSEAGIRQRWQAGYDHMIRVLRQQPWTAESDPLEGFILHDMPAATTAGQDADGD